MRLVAPNSKVLVHENMMMNMLCPNISKMVRISWSIRIKINVLMQIVSVLYVFNVCPDQYYPEQEENCKVPNNVLFIFFHLISYVGIDKNHWHHKVDIIDPIKFGVCFLSWIFIKSDSILVIYLSWSFGKRHKFSICHLSDLWDQWLLDINHCIQSFMH